MFTGFMGLSARSLCWKCKRRFTSGAHRIAEGDRIILRVKDNSKTPLFTKPLRRGKTVVSRWGSISHETLIGRGARDVVVTSTGCELRIHIPTLHDYVKLTPRLVTPVYPADANLIVSLLDIHVSHSERTPEDPPLEILEAGTGHGALTLHLARAIHAANPTPPEVFAQPHPRTNEVNMQDKEVANSTMDMRSDVSSVGSTATKIQSSGVLQQWRSQRKAVIHTVDVSERHSQHAQKIVHEFKRGMYAGDVNFNVGNVNEWIDHQCAERNEQTPRKREFLSHVILDLPASHLYIAKAASVIHTDGALLVFNPNVTQIMACVELIRSMKLPLALDCVLETGSSMTGGREWDVRAVKPRASLKAEKEKTDITLAESGISEAEPSESKMQLPGSILDPKTNGKEEANAPLQEKGQWEMICKPKIGDRITTGGFLGVWRKMRHREM